MEDIPAMYLVDALDRILLWHLCQPDSVSTLQVNISQVFEKPQGIATYYLAATRMIGEKFSDLQDLAHMRFPAFSCTDIIDVAVQNHPAAVRSIVCFHCVDN